MTDSRTIETTALMSQVTADSYATRLERALPSVLERIERAAEESGRGRHDVRLVAVTKSHPIAAVEAALGAGLTDLGENRVEELVEKVELVGGGDVCWHMIGHLQSRKARIAASVADVIHSVDSTRLATKLARVGEEEGREVAVLAQVNTSGEESKSGFSLDSALDEIASMAELPGLRVNGLMTMAPFVDDEVVLGDAFASLRRLGEELRGSGLVGRELSMGMTNDLEIAIREGSTMVRIGTALFGERAR